MNDRIKNGWSAMMLSWDDDDEDSESAEQHAFAVATADLFDAIEAYGIGHDLRTRTLGVLGERDDDLAQLSRQATQMGIERLQRDLIRAAQVLDQAGRVLLAARPRAGRSLQS